MNLRSKQREKRSSPRTRRPGGPTLTVAGSIPDQRQPQATLTGPASSAPSRATRPKRTIASEPAPTHPGAASLRPVAESLANYRSGRMSERSRLTTWRRRYLNVRVIIALIALGALLLSTVAEVIGAAL